jgi:hypothetical protein
MATNGGKGAWRSVKVGLYQTLPSVSDNHLFVVCRGGEFSSLPDHVRHRGPWQGMHRGEREPQSRLLAPRDLEEQVYSLVRCALAVFKPEA